ncbi:MAG: hypothetical protein KGY67_00450 [Candidatus Thermoplasmatota archaeon]|nr:hypothetical protein [Candidatus Thermoplasmatota archaeon]
MRQFMLTNKPGFDMKTAIENPSFRHSIIKVLDADGTVLDELPWHPVTDYMYEPIPDPRYRKPHIVHMQSGELNVNPSIPENHVTSGENPYVQLIYNYTKKDSHTIEEIIRHLINDKKVLSDTNESRIIVKKLVVEMFKGETLGGLLIKRGNNYIAGVDIKLGRRLIPIHHGYNMYEYEILTLAKQKGTVSRDELFSLLSYSGDKYQWVRNDKTISFYLNKLLKKNCLVKMGDDWFRFNHYPERKM